MIHEELGGAFIGEAMAVPNESGPGLDEKGQLRWKRVVRDAEDYSAPIREIRGKSGCAVKPDG